MREISEGNSKFDSKIEEVNIFASGLDNKSVPKFFGVFIKVIGGGDDC